MGSAVVSEGSVVSAVDVVGAVVSPVPDDDVDEVALTLVLVEVAELLGTTITVDVVGASVVVEVDGIGVGVKVTYT